jgi:phosphatidylserine/phosphatidylglycerophosphate/cardiolipin synthase-like enzyme
MLCKIGTLSSFMLICAVSLKCGEHTANPRNFETLAKVEVYFSPGCTDRIVYEINQAKSYIGVLAYSYTSEPIGKALVRAKKRGVEVKAIVDSGRVFEPKSFVNESREAFEVRSDPKHAIMHQKVIVIDPDTDSAVVIVGSFNFSAAAEYNNAENINVIRSREAAKCYRDNMLEHSKHSTIVTDAMEKEYFEKLAARKELEAAKHEDNGYSIWTLLFFVVFFVIIKYIVDKLLSRR